jgi:hypothetical protein
MLYSLHNPAQDKTLNQECDFLNNLHFKNGADTVSILAYKNANVRWRENEPNLLKLFELNKLVKNNFFAIVIKPVGCDTEYPVYCSDMSKFADSVDQRNHKAPVHMRCIVFENLQERSHPVFIVDKIEP